MRHGEISSKGRFIGKTDLPLTKTGRMQMAAWRPYFHAIPIDAIYSSEFERSRHSAELIVEPGNGPIHILPELAEIDLGEWEGREMAEIKTRYPEAWEARGRNMDMFRSPKGESFLDVSHRVVPVFERLALLAQGKSLLLMGHAGVNRVILCHVLGMPLKNLFRLEQQFACLNIIAYREGLHFLKKINLGKNEVGHLSSPLR
jgi:probable phosphoglycerate mutase